MVSGYPSLVKIWSTVAIDKNVLREGQTYCNYCRDAALLLKWASDKIHDDQGHFRLSVFSVLWCTQYFGRVKIHQGL